MSLKRALLIVALVIAMLIPLGQLLRTQNPWNCFNFTYDESYFLQATANWVDGKGYRTFDQTKPFDPLITVGIPMAWGTRVVRDVTHLDLGHSARTWVHFCFYLLLGILTAAAYRRTRNWQAPIFTLLFFSLAIRGIPYGSYFVYGYLSEAPAIALGTLALLALDRNRFFRAGLFAVAAFILKPTFLLLLPAVSIAAFVADRRRGFLSALATGAGLFLYFYYVAQARDQSIAAYFGDYAKTALRVSLTFPGMTILSYYESAGVVATLVTALALIGGVWRRTPSRIAVALLVASGIAYYVIQGVRPVDKQWGAILCLAAAVLAIHLGNWIAARFAGAFSQERTVAVFLAVVVTWIINVPPMLKKQFTLQEENRCPSKEQRHVGELLRAKSVAENLTRKDIGVLISSPSFHFFIYELGWNPPYDGSWKNLGSPLPKYVAGQIDRLLPAPNGCAPEWLGGSFGVLRCRK
jgi:hypothetical protein